jgi:glycosyltransferase involved in cell wall biosynthesis
MRYLVEHGRTGLLSPPGDANALAQNVIQLLENPALAEQLAENARLELERYSWPVVREQWLGIYRNLASRETPSAAPESAQPTDELANAEADHAQA